MKQTKFLLFKNFLLSDLREREEVGERERETPTLLFHLFVCSLVDSCMCPDQGLNPQPWHTGTML